MSLGQCIPGMVDRGEITPEKAKEMSGLFTELEQDFRRQFDHQTAASMASDATLKQLAYTAARKRTVHLKQIAGQERLLFDAGTYDGGKGGGKNGGGGPINPAAVAALIDRDGKATFFNVEGRRKALERRAFAYMDSLLERFHTDVLGRVRNIDDMGVVVRELFGKDTGNLAAKEMAESWGKAAEMLRMRFNAAGGDIAKLERWGLPQSHDYLKVREAGFEAWRADILPLLDRERMMDPTTGLKFSPEKLELALKDVHETIRSDGWFKRKPGGAVGKGMLANQRNESRFFVFKDGDSWLSYQGKYGHGSPFEAMVGHVKGMSRDIAAMERFGPNPEASVGWLKDHIDQSAKLDKSPGSKALDRADAGQDRIDGLWNEYTGANKKPAIAWLANTGSAVRSYETATKLGSAIISAVPGDLGTQRLTAKFNGLPFTKVLGNYLKQLNPLSAEDRKFAIQMALGHEGWTNHAASSMRALNSEMASGRMAQVAETVLRGQGLGAWTDAGNAASGMTIFGHMGTVAGKTFDKLDPHFRGMLTRYGIDAGKWDTVRATPPRMKDGAKYIFGQDVKDQELGDRLIEMAATESTFAVPVADLGTKAMFSQLKGGTVLGEAAKTSLLFKSFGIAMVLGHGRRMMELSNWKDKSSYLISTLATMTLAGAASIQFREIAKGNDPRPMDDWKFWGAALFQGGGFGIVGDLLDLAVNPRLGSFAAYVGGPAVDTAQNIAKLGSDAFKAMTGDKHANPGGDLIRFIQADVPGSNIWYARLAIQRLLIDHLSEAIDPNYRQSWRRMDKRAKDMRTQSYWRHGETAPDRAPDLTNAIGGQP